jgi:RNA polymerase sigma-70 factor (ECF subfamily)
MPDTSASLLAQLRNPSQRSAWDELVELYSPLLYYWARRIPLQDADAADLVQEVFAILVRELPEFEYDRTRSFRGWLRTITLNKWREIARRKSDALARATDAPIDEIEAPAGDDVFGEIEHRRLMMRRFLEAVRSEFQPATWSACWDSVIEGLTAAEVGQKLNLSPGAVRAAKFRVLSRVRTKFLGMLD